MTSPIFRIAHLSDTHVSPEYNRHNITKLRKLLSYVVDSGYNHVVITGDITGHGESRDFRSIRRILKYFGLLNYDKLTVTIGNHDIFGGVHKIEDVFSFKRRCKSTSYHTKLDQFESAFRETFPKKAFATESLFPFVKIVGPVALIGLNSVAEFHPILNPVGSNGLVSAAQIESTRRILEHPLMRAVQKVVLIHHHFGPYEPNAESLSGSFGYMIEAFSLKQYRKKRLEKFLQVHGVSAILHGHTHIEECYRRSGIQFSSTALTPIASRRKLPNDELVMIPGTVRFNEVSIDSIGGIEISTKLVSSRKINQPHHVAVNED